MSGIHKFLFKKERRRKHHHGASDSVPQAWSLFAISTNSSAHQHKVSKHTISKLERNIAAKGIPYLGKRHILFALQSKYAAGDDSKAFQLLMIIEDSVEGILRTYNPDKKLLGAENRDGVTCYLDSLLFAMFARLDCFEAILYNTFDDEPRRNLTVLLRLWVNLLRTGKLITTDITKKLQEALAACGWEDAALSKQQDVSEAFNFITEKLELPLLTLKMDIFHPGKEDTGHDHRFVNERLLELAIPPSESSDDPVTLEDCLESYFNNRIEVTRYLERQNTTNSTLSVDSTAKGAAAHIENVELVSSPCPVPEDSVLSEGLSREPAEISNPVHHAVRPSPASTSLRSRSSSITQTYHFEDEGAIRPNPTRNVSRVKMSRASSMRKEVMIPAWQMFSLIPWYTDSAPMNGAETAAHFSSKRPILGMCLKRYSVLPSGRAVRLDTYVDIPTEIGLPQFIKNDGLDENGPVYGNFKLSLQAVVCHRGNSVDSGHYISLVRGTTLGNSDTLSSRSSHDDSMPPAYSGHWMRFDDLAEERITLVDIEKALQEESPYLLFYQVLPLEADPGELIPPPYEDHESINRYLLDKAIPSDTSSDEEARSSGEYTRRGALSDATNRAHLRRKSPLRM